MVALRVSAKEKGGEERCAALAWRPPPPRRSFAAFVRALAETRPSKQREHADYNHMAGTNGNHAHLAV